MARLTKVRLTEAFFDERSKHFRDGGIVDSPLLHRGMFVEIEAAPITPLPHSNVVCGEKIWKISDAQVAAVDPTAMRPKYVCSHMIEID